MLLKDLEDFGVGIVIPTVSLVTGTSVPYNVTNIMYIDVDYDIGYIDEYVTDYIPEYVPPTMVEYDISTTTPTTDLPSPGKF